MSKQKLQEIIDQLHDKYEHQESILTELGNSEQALLKVIKKLMEIIKEEEKTLEQSKDEAIEYTIEWTSNDNGIVTDKKDVRQLMKYDGSIQKKVVSNFNDIVTQKMAELNKLREESNKEKASLNEIAQRIHGLGQLMLELDHPVKSALKQAVKAENVDEIINLIKNYSQILDSTFIISNEDFTKVTTYPSLIKFVLKSNNNTEFLTRFFHAMLQYSIETADLKVAEKAVTKINEFIEKAILKGDLALTKLFINEFYLKPEYELDLYGDINEFFQLAAMSNDTIPVMEYLLKTFYLNRESPLYAPNLGVKLLENKALSAAAASNSLHSLKYCLTLIDRKLPGADYDKQHCFQSAVYHGAIETMHYLFKNIDFGDLMFTLRYDLINNECGEFLNIESDSDSNSDSDSDKERFGDEPKYEIFQHFAHIRSQEPFNLDNTMNLLLAYAIARGVSNEELAKMLAAGKRDNSTEAIEQLINRTPEILAWADARLAAYDTVQAGRNFVNVIENNAYLEKVLGLDTRKDIKLEKGEAKESVRLGMQALLGTIIGDKDFLAKNIMPHVMGDRSFEKLTPALVQEFSQFGTANMHSPSQVMEVNKKSLTESVNVNELLQAAQKAQEVKESGATTTPPVKRRFSDSATISSSTDVTKQPDHSSRFKNPDEKVSRKL
jgi:hypothetical protein